MPLTGLGDVKVKTLKGNYEAFELKVAGTQTAGTGKGKIWVPFLHKIVRVDVHLATAPTGAAFLVDVNSDAIAGASIFTTQSARPSVAISGKNSTGGVPAVTAGPAGTEYTVDNDQVGSSVAGADLWVTMTVQRLAA